MYTLNLDKNAQKIIFVERRIRKDRRKTSSFSIRSLLFVGRRETIRRDEDRHNLLYVDRYKQLHFVVILLTLFLSVIDALFTIELINHGAKEINPIMAYFLNVGPYTFFSIKYSLTSAGLIVLLMFRDICIKPLRICAGSFLYCFFIIFIGVVSWQSFMYYSIIK
jgi:hypothetical protein